MKTSYFLATLLSSCSSVTLSQGYISPSLGFAHYKDTQSLSSSYTTLQATQTLKLPAAFSLSIGAGPTIITPDTRSPLYGAEVTMQEVWGPVFLEQGYGVVEHTARWQGSDVDYEFITRFGAGVQVNLTDNLLLSLSYQYVHLSNGMTVLCDSTRQFFHLPKATKNRGFESGALFLGITWEW